ncbi:four helix bundle protein [Algoriphagus halophytocola]|uniref:four helix bundle protein n=1 Tax=Algoriphagus halophytocola TaxID=2991499 RepID=UPI0022DE5BBE|nr:four helix bundle protein [Algoriphagus sp. TR-M9]WBL42775.1 four helix bundle protein [Algoriphagus sp. TR-M9]
MHNFKNLKVWQKSVDLAVKIYKITSEFPVSEKFGMTSQMRRAGVSIPSNIAEGTAKSFSNSLEISLGESFELETQMIIAERVNLISNETAQQLEADISEVQRMILGFKATLTT